MKKLGAGLAVVVLLTTAGCGGGGRPSADEVSKALQKGFGGSDTSGAKLTKKQADCAGKVFVDSKISDGALNAIVDGKKDYKESKADDKALQGISQKLIKCVS